MPRPHRMDPLIDDFAPLAEKFGRTTACVAHRSR